MTALTKLIASATLGASLLFYAGCSASVDAPPASVRQAASSVTLAVEGMTCRSCSVAVRTTLKKLAGVQEAKVSVSEKRAVVEYDPAKVTPQRLIDAVNRLGYKASLQVTGS